MFQETANRLKEEVRLYTEKLSAAEKEVAALKAAIKSLNKTIKQFEGDVTNEDQPETEI